MTKLIFYTLYSIGGSLFILVLLFLSVPNLFKKIRYRQFGLSFALLKKPLMNHQVKISFPRFLLYYTMTAIIWTALWLIGVLQYKTNITLTLGILPIGMILLTWLSLSISFIKNKIEHKYNKNKQAKRIVPVINHWVDEISSGCDLMINNIYWDLIEKKNNRLSGRVIITISDCKNQQINWDLSVKELKSKLNSNISVEIVTNSKKVYPKYDFDDNNPYRDNNYVH